MLFRTRTGSHKFTTVSFGGLSQQKDSQRGMALLIVVFVIALCSIIVVNLSQSAFREARISNASVKRIQAEYLLKSAINFARVLLSKDASQDVDSSGDVWAGFSKGQAIPVPEILGINEPGLNIEIEIQAEDQRFPIRALLTGAGGASARVDIKWRNACVKLFKELGFDEDTEEADHTKLFPGRHFNSEELVTLLIDYMDFDSESYSAEDGDFIDGFEGDLPEGSFVNTPIKRIGELATIPGFTPARLRKLYPFITVFESGKININLAPPQIIKSLSDDLDDEALAEILNIRASEEPFSPQSLGPTLRNIIGEDNYNDVANMLKTNSGWFQILAKVQYGPTTYFMRAFVSKKQSAESGELPAIKSVELF